MTQQAQSIRVTRGGAAVTDAEVTVNGFRLAHCCGDLYEGKLPEPVRAGDMLKLKVVAGGVSFEAPGEVAPTPTITAPAAGSTITATDPVSLVWTSPVDPDDFEVCLNCWANALEGAIYRASGSARRFEIAPGTLVDYGTGTIVAVYAYKTNFLKSTGSAKVRLSVSYMARSRDAIITVR
jgi:hypothetical protein